MPYEDCKDIQTLILHLTWLCINGSDWINPRFHAIFPSFDDVAALLPKLGITFCDGLLDVVQSCTAPSIEWFLSQPTDIPPRIWGIYVLVLCKDGHFKIYVGSGTGSIKNGVRNRVMQHKRRDVEPVNIRNAKDEGYTQVHSSLLAWCPCPAPAQVPVFRTGLVAVEAVFHFIFWPMLTPTKHYGFPDGGPWAREDFQWGGLCSHNPLIEGIIKGVDDITFTPEQLENMAAAATKRRNDIRKAYDQKLRANKTPEYAAYRLAASRRSQPKVAAVYKLRVETKVFHCSTCNITCRNQWGLDRHCNTDRHKDNIADGIGSSLYCKPCDYLAKERNILRRHLSSARHAKRCAASAQN